MLSFTVLLFPVAAWFPSLDTPLPLPVPLCRQRRDDHKMIELLLPLNTIRFKYGMPERAGCGEVRPDLLEELERQQREKQPTRSRSVEQLGLPPPQLHKSRSMELGRDAAKSDAGWQLTPETASAAAGRMGRSAENLTQIAEDEPVVISGFTAVPEGAVGGVTEEAANDRSEGGAKDGEKEAGGEEVSASGEAVVKWELGSDDENGDGKVEEKQDKVPAAPPVMWPEVKIVVEEDVDVKADRSENDSDANDAGRKLSISNEAHKESENVFMRVGEAPEQASLSDAALLAPESESDFDFWGSTEQDFSSNTDDNDKSGMESAVQTPRLKTPERTPSPSLAEANPATLETEKGGDISPDEEASEGNADKDNEQQPAEVTNQATTDQTEGEETTFSFWDVSDEDEKVQKDVKESPPSANSSELKDDDQRTDKDGVPSFWDDTEDEEKTKKNEDVDEADRGTGDQTNDCDGMPITIHREKETLEDPAPNVTGNGDLNKSEGNVIDEAEETTKDSPTTNGETFSFWNTSDEEDTEQAPTFPRSKTYLWADDDDTAEEPVHPKADPNRSSDALEPTDSTCCGRVPSPTGDGWDATSAEHPSHTGSGAGSEAPGRLSPRPLSVPHITLSDDSELMPAR